MSKLYEWVCRLLHIPMDWEKYDYIVENGPGYTIYTHIECGYADDYVGKDRVLDFTVALGTHYWNGTEYKVQTYLSKLPKGYRVRNKLKSIQCQRLQPLYEFRVLPVRPIKYPCQGESVLSLSSRRYQALEKLGCEVVRIEDEGLEFYKVPMDKLKQFKQIITAYGD